MEHDELSKSTQALIGLIEEELQSDPNVLSDLGPANWMALAGRLNAVKEALGFYRKVSNMTADAGIAPAYIIAAQAPAAASRAPAVARFALTLGRFHPVVFVVSVLVVLAMTQESILEGTMRRAAAARVEKRVMELGALLQRFAGVTPQRVIVLSSLAAELGGILGLSPDDVTIKLDDAEAFARLTAAIRAKAPRDQPPDCKRLRTDFANKSGRVTQAQHNPGLWMRRRPGGLVVIPRFGELCEQFYRAAIDYLKCALGMDGGGPPPGAAPA